MYSPIMTNGIPSNVKNGNPPSSVIVAAIAIQKNAKQVKKTSKGIKNQSAFANCIPGCGLSIHNKRSCRVKYGWITCFSIKSMFSINERFIRLVNQKIFGSKKDVEFDFPIKCFF